MLSRAVNQIQQSPWARLVWAGIAVLVLVQVVVFYRLCVSQVERAHARETVAVIERNTLTDCLDFLQKSTISTCSRQSPRSGDSDGKTLGARDLPRVRSGAPTVLAGAVPVSYVISAPARPR